MCMNGLFMEGSGCGNRIREGGGCGGRVEGGSAGGFTEGVVGSGSSTEGGGAGGIRFLQEGGSCGN